MQLIWLTSSITKMLPTKLPHISKTNPYQLFHIPILHPLHPTFSIIKGYCRTSRLFLQKLSIQLWSFWSGRYRGDLTIIENESLYNILSKGPKYREPRSIDWNYNFKFLMDAVENYARKWIKRKQEDIDSLSEWLKAVRSLILKRMRVF